MNGTSPTAREGASIVRAMICFGLTVAAVLFALAIWKELGRVVPPQDYRDTLWAHMFEFLILVLFMALASALLFGALLWLIERRSSKPLGIVIWLIAGVVALAPMAGFYWFIDTAFEMLEFDPQPPYAWVNIRPPLIMLSHGLIGALAAWLLRRRKIAA